MKVSFAGFICLVVTLALGVRPEAAVADSSRTIYFSNFDGGGYALDGTQFAWSGNIGLTPVQGYSGIGTNGNVFAGNLLWNRSGGTAANPGTVAAQPCILTLTNLPPHNQLDVGFLLAIIDSWDGAAITPADYMPDIYNVQVDGQLVFSEAFQNSLNANGEQTYQPGAPTQLVNNQQLGFTAATGNVHDKDDAYDMGFEPQFQGLVHSNNSVTIQWFASGAGWQGSSDESWAIDNVTIGLNYSDTNCPRGMAYETRSLYRVGESLVPVAPTFVVTNPVQQFVVSPTLPPGMFLDATSGALSGVPTENAHFATYLVQAETDCGPIFASFRFEVRNRSANSGAITYMNGIPPLAPSAGGPITTIGLRGDGGVGFAGKAWPGRELHAWSPARGLQLVDTRGGASAGYVEQYVGSSADGSTVVGYFRTESSDNAQGFRWSAAHGFEPLLSLQGTNGTALANEVSGDGSLVVGSSGSKACVWGTNGQPVDLGNDTTTGSDFFVVADDVSDDATVVVGYGISGGVSPVAMRWTSAGGAVTLGGATSSRAHVVSGDGATIFGVAGGVDPFRWTESEGMVLLENPFEPHQTFVEDASDDGSVMVGSLRFPSPLTVLPVSTVQAMVWEEGTEEVLDLNEVVAEAGIDLGGLKLITADAVSGDGTRISGRARWIDERNDAVYLYVLDLDWVRDCVPPGTLAYPSTLQLTIGDEVGPLLPGTINHPDMVFSVSPPLPVGMTLDPATGVISGHALMVMEPASYMVSVQSPCGSAQAILSVEVLDSFDCPTILAYDFPPSLDLNLAIAPVSPMSVNPLAFSNYVVNPALPAGLSLNPFDGVISGTPTQIVSMTTYVITATNPCMNVEAAITFQSGCGEFAYVFPRVIPRNQALTPVAMVSRLGGFSNFSVTPPLPAGLTLDPSTGMISGTARGLTPWRIYTVSAEDLCGVWRSPIAFVVEDIVVQHEYKTLEIDAARAEEAGTSGLDIHNGIIAIGAVRQSSSGRVHLFERNEGGADNWGRTVSRITGNAVNYLAFQGGDLMFGEAYSTVDGHLPRPGSASVLDGLFSGAPQEHILTLSEEFNRPIFGVYNVAIDGKTAAFIGRGNSGGSILATYTNFVDSTGESHWIAGQELHEPHDPSAAIPGGAGIAMDNGLLVWSSAGSGGTFVYERHPGAGVEWVKVQTLSRAGGVVMHGGVMAIYNSDAKVIYVYETPTGTNDQWAEVAQLRPWRVKSTLGFDFDVYGDRIVISSRGFGDAALGEFSGEVYVYNRNQLGPGVWGLERVLKPVRFSGYSTFGYAVAIDGDTVAVTDEYAYNSEFSVHGEVYVFDLVDIPPVGQVTQMDVRVGYDAMNNPQFKFDGFPGLIYRLQECHDLSDGHWIDRGAATIDPFGKLDLPLTPLNWPAYFRIAYP